jgi:hypothetical protein
MQPTAGIGAQTDHIAGIGWYFGGDENDVEHSKHIRRWGPVPGQWSGF